MLVAGIVAIMVLVVAYAFYSNDDNDYIDHDLGVS